MLSYNVWVARIKNNGWPKYKGAQFWWVNHIHDCLMQTYNSNQSTHHFKFYNQSWDAKKKEVTTKWRFSFSLSDNIGHPHYELLSNLYLLMNCEHIWVFPYTKQIQVYDEGEYLPPMMACKSQACNDGPKSLSTRSLLKNQKKKIFLHGQSSLFD